MEYSAHFIDNQAMIGIIRRACGCVDKRLMDHGIRVAYIVSRLLRGIPGIGAVRLRDICFLAALHDIGAYKTEEIDRMLQFETGSIWEHSVYGYLFIKYFSPLADMAPAILFHHTPWSVLENEHNVSRENKYIAQLIDIADRLDICLNAERRPYEDFIQMLKSGRGVRFEASLIDRLLAEQFSSFTEEDVAHDPVFCQMQSEVPFSGEEIDRYLRMIIYSIDFRSRHTVTHTMTTTSISYELAKRMRLDPDYCNEVVCGALLHDLGKIGIPVEILEYPGKLSPQAMAVMRTHVNITEYIFADDIPLPIRRIALRHHEKLDGSGYPHGLAAAELNIGERIVAVADIVSALAGTRSYKDAYGKGRIISIISDMRGSGLIDPAAVSCVISHYDAILQQTQLRCQPVLDVYQTLQNEYADLYAKYGGL